MCNWLSQFFDCFLAEFQNWVLQFPPWMHGAIERGLLGGSSSPTSTAALDALYQQPTAQPWLQIWEATWVGAGTPEMLAVSLAVLVLGVKVRSLAMALGVGDAVRARAANRNVRTGFFLVVFWYPLALLYLFGVNSLLYWVYPPDPVATFMAFFFAPLAQVQFISTAVNAAIGVLGVGALLLITFILVVRTVLMWVYLWCMPLLFAVYYSELPYLDEIARRLGFRFLPLSLIPLVPAVFLRITTRVFTSEAMVPGLPASVTAAMFLLMAAFGSWKLFRISAPQVEKGLKIGAGVTAGAALTAMGSPYAGAMATGGRIVPAAALASRSFEGSGGGANGGGGGGEPGVRGRTGGHSGSDGTTADRGSRGSPSSGTGGRSTPPALPPGDPCRNTSGFR